MNNSYPPPTFDDWSTFPNEQLQGMLKTWQWIQANPGWKMWHSQAKDFITQIEFELQQRQRVIEANM